MIKIEEKVPFPTNKYPFRELEVGQSFFVESEDFAQACYGAIRSIAYREKKTSGKVFTVRKVDGGIRVWRTL